VLVLLKLVIVVGCGQPGAPKTAGASGQVTLQGQPVTTGQIYFVAAEKGFSANGSLGADGKYEISSNLPPANYKVFFTPPRAANAPMPGKPSVETKVFELPSQYLNETTSGMSAEVKAGDNTIDFRLN